MDTAGWAVSEKYNAAISWTPNEHTAVDGAVGKHSGTAVENTWWHHHHHLQESYTAAVSSKHTLICGKPSPYHHHHNLQESTATVCCKHVPLLLTPCCSHTSHLPTANVPMVHTV